MLQARTNRPCHTKRAQTFCVHGDAAAARVVGAVCSEVLGGKNLAALLRVGFELKTCAMAALEAGEPADVLSVYTSAGMPVQHEMFIDALAPHVPTATCEHCAPVKTLRVYTLRTPTMHPHHASVRHHAPVRIMRPYVKHHAPIKHRALVKHCAPARHHAPVHHAPVTLCAPVDTDADGSCARDYRRWWWWLGGHLGLLLCGSRNRRSPCDRWNHICFCCDVKDASRKS